MNHPDKEPPKIIIDEDWKTQVQREKEQLKQTPASEEHSAESQAAPPQDSTEEYPPLPAPSFELLVTTLATQAMACMGQIPDPIDNQVSVQLDIAKHHIDMLAMLEAKTRGNLETHEAQLLEDVLHQLRMIYVAVGRR